MRSRTRRRLHLTRRPALILFGASLLAGSAFLAGNDVSPTNASTTSIAVELPTEISIGAVTLTKGALGGARPVVATNSPNDDLTGTAATSTTTTPPATYHLTMSATLSDGDTPLAGYDIVFAASGRSCRAVSDASGTARCSLDGLAQQPSSWSATFAGTEPFAPSSARGTLGAPSNAIPGTP